MFKFAFILILLSFVIAVQSQANETKSDNSWKPIVPSKDKKASVTKAETRKEKPSAYEQAIINAASMTRDARTIGLVSKYGLNIMNITWEDTGRYKGSSVGPNISDMSIQVGLKNKEGKYDLTLMPVIRYDNFTDKTADVDPMQFTLLVGNEKGADLKRISLREFLEDPTKYLHNAKSWLNPKKSLLAERDTKVLVSAQASFLPVPKKSKAEFNPVLFNYQSVSGDPAVLAILVTRQGTSTTVIDNKRDSVDGRGWGQRLFHNQNGQRASLTGQRLSDFAKTKEGQKSDTIKDQAKLDVKKSSGLNMVLLIQIPLKQKNPPKYEGGIGGCANCMYSMSDKSLSIPSSKSDVEAAVIGHGDFQGPYTEIDNLSIERDTKFPVRVTVQFYKATATGVASEQDIKQIKEEIDSIFEMGSAVGSLVVDGETGRPTEYEGIKVQPSDWWTEFWKRHEQNTGEKPEEAINRLKKLLGENYQEQPICELLVSEKLRK